MNTMKNILLLLLSGCLAGAPVEGQQLRTMTRSGAALGDSSLTLMSDTLSSKTTFVTRAASLAQVRKGLSKFAFDSVVVTGPLRANGASILTSNLTYGGVTLSNAVTGSGNMVLSASPTFTGTAAFATVTASTIGKFGTNPADVGVIGIGNQQRIQGRNATNAGNVNIAYIDGSNNLIWGPGDVVSLSTTAMAFSSIALSGITTLAASNLVDLSAAGAGQIKFPATQNASADVNTLDDYKEGSWTPAIKFGGGNTGITYTAQVGTYTKIGNRLCLEGAVLLSSKGSSTGSATLEGLPVATASFASLYVGNASSITGAGMVMIFTSGSASNMTINYATSTGPASMTDLTFTNATTLYFSGCYRTA